MLDKKLLSCNNSFAESLREWSQRGEIANWQKTNSRSSLCGRKWVVDTTKQKRGMIRPNV